MANTKKYVSFDKLGVYDEKIKGVISAGDAATLTAANAYADGLASNYDAAGSAASALAEAKSYADGKNAAIQAAQKAGDDAAAAAAEAARLAGVAQGEVDALETYVGTFTHDTAKTVVEYVNAKTAGIASESAMTELGNRVGVVEGKVSTIEGDYLKGADKTALEGKIGEVSAAVAAEETRAKGIEGGLETRLAAVEGDYLKGADKTELQGNIDTLTGVVNTLRDGVDADKVDGINDLIKYVEDHGAEVTGMLEDIEANADAIEGVAGRMTTAEGKITALEGASATHATTEALNAAVAALEGADTGMGNRIAALEAKHGDGEGTVESLIATAKAEAIAAAASDAASKDEAVLAAAKKYADDEDAKIEERVGALETASATHALASDLTALDGRVAIAEGEIDTLQSEMDAVEAVAAANKAAHEANAAAILLKADITALNAVGDRVTALETWHNNFTEVSEDEINSLFA